MRREMPLVLLMTLFIPSAGQAQAVGVVTGAPFIANWVTTTQQTGGAVTISGKIARARDGSVYRTFAVGAGTRIEIMDVPGQRDVWVYQHDGHCDMSILHREWVVRSAAQEKAVFEHWQGIYDKGLDRTETSENKHITGLGTKFEGGVEIFGHRYTSTRADGTVVSDGEVWQTEQGVPVSGMHHVVAENRTESSKMTDYVRVVPEAALFQPPEGCMTRELRR